MRALTVCQGEAAPCLDIADRARELMPCRVPQHHPHVQASELARHGDGQVKSRRSCLIPTPRDSTMPVSQMIKNDTESVDPRPLWALYRHLGMGVTP